MGDGRVAARSKGAEFRNGEADQECPICFLYYSEVNVTKCCNANLCTECYFQVRPQKEKHPTCPFCNNQKLSISIAKKLSADQILEREKDEKQIEDARKKARDGSPEENETISNNSSSDGFGSSLEQDSRVALLRARSESFASSEENNKPDENNLIQSLAMSPEERRRLEEEMRAQLSHPLTMQMEAEANERRMENDRAYYQTQSGSLRELRAQRAAELFRTHSARVSSSRRRGGPGGRDWNQIVGAFERGGNGEIQSLDDLVVLEAAILLSMEEDARRSRGGEEPSAFDAARHARDGFPLVRSFLANRDAPASNAQVQSLARSLSSTNRRRNQLLRAGYRTSSPSPDSTIETANMLMQGISEEEQIAMAIAASLQDQTNTTNEDQEDNSTSYSSSDHVEESSSNSEQVGLEGVAVDRLAVDRLLDALEEPIDTASGLPTGSVAIGVVADEDVEREESSSDSASDLFKIGETSDLTPQSPETTADDLAHHGGGEGEIVNEILIQEPVLNAEDLLEPEGAVGGTGDGEVPS